jgi:hypothetical protein
MGLLGVYDEVVRERSVFAKSYSTYVAERAQIETVVTKQVSNQWSVFVEKAAVNGNQKMFQGRCFTQRPQRSKGRKEFVLWALLFAYSWRLCGKKKKSKMFHAKTAKSAASLGDLCALSLRPLREMYSFIEPTHPWFFSASSSNQIPYFNVGFHDERSFDREGLAGLRRIEVPLSARSYFGHRGFGSRSVEIRLRFGRLLGLNHVETLLLLGSH